MSNDPRDPRNIANTILDQCGRGFGGTLMCIGMHKPTIVPRDDARGILGGVTFKVNPNPKVKVHAQVMITLNASDTYTVRIITCRGKMVLDASDVYCDNLGGRDGILERTLG
jgi:hypothetical protein